MCAQRTYRRATGEKGKAQVNTNMGFLQKITHHVNPAGVCQKAPQKPSAIPQNGAPNGAQIEPKPMRHRGRAHLGQQLAAKRCPRVPKMRPRCAQEGAKSAQEGAKRTHVGLSWRSSSPFWGVLGLMWACSSNLERLLQAKWSKCKNDHHSHSFGSFFEP